jgi:syntaxin 17
MDKPKPKLSSAQNSPVNEWPSEGRLEEAELPPLQVQVNLAAEEEDLAKKEAYLRSWQQLQTDFEDLNHIFRDFSQMVHEQKELVNEVEQHVETAAVNVEEGNKILAKAAKMKSAAYPMFGALIGGCMAGPIGMVAGLKLGALAGLSGGILGFTGGKLLKYNEVEPEKPVEEEQPKEELTVAQPTTLDVIS